MHRADERDEAEFRGDSEAVGLGARRCRDAEGVNPFTIFSIILVARALKAVR
jgi:hypothetical protein